jgi:hypothetical protein
MDMKVSLESLYLKHFRACVGYPLFMKRSINALVGAGYRSSELISSEITLLYAYAFYLVGKTECHIPETLLQKLIGRWFLSASLTGRYTGSPETVMDGDLNRLKEVRDAEAFVALLDKIIDDSLTQDFWTITLPNELDTSSARSPVLFAYYAAQNKLGAPVLFSHKKISELLDPALKLKKKALERHHLFPRAWLESQGIDDLKLINQAANFALLEWPENIEISDEPPAIYLPRMRERFSRLGTDVRVACVTPRLGTPVVFRVSGSAPQAHGGNHSTRFRNA